LFDRQLEVGSKSLVYLNESSFSSYSLKLEGNNLMNPKIYFGYKPEYIFDWTFISKNDSIVYNESAIDSLIQLRVGKRIRNEKFDEY